MIRMYHVITTDLAPREPSRVAEHWQRERQRLHPEHHELADVVREVVVRQPQPDEPPLRERRGERQRDLRRRRVRRERDGQLRAAPRRAAAEARPSDGAAAAAGGGAVVVEHGAVPGQTLDSEAVVVARLCRTWNASFRNASPK